MRYSGKTPEQIRKLFHIQNDFTPEEEEAVRAENKWAEESWAPKRQIIEVMMNSDPNAMWVRGTLAW